MRRLTLLLLLISLAQFSNAGIQVQSFYFRKNSTKLTSSSQLRLNEFISTLGDSSIQVLELSSYADGNTADSNKRLSDARMTHIVEMLGPTHRPQTINSWGSKRIKVRFTPVNWDRIDIYCQVNDLSDDLDYSKIERPSIIDTESTSHKPLILNILFEGGTSVMVKETLPYLQDLYEALRKNPNLTAHIRGHVCCENNKRLSKTRAKEVYEYLIEKGISADQLSYKGYGNKVPLVTPERDAEDRRLNRRVDVIFSLEEEE
ncbi:MAG: OmpA family protein [Crocinitomicaceae bacterium]|nr:OmpA family protein [Crocinitomicaceae bacterium]